MSKVLKFSLFFLGLGCAGAAPAVVGAAAANATIAGVASGVSRANGGCYSQCNYGTKCNEKTGLCEEVPCGGACKEGEYCDTRQKPARCIPDVMPQVIVK